MRPLASRFCWLSAIPLWGTPRPRESTGEMKRKISFAVYVRHDFCRRLSKFERYVCSQWSELFKWLRVDGREEYCLASCLKFQVCSILYREPGNYCPLEILAFWLDRTVPMKLMAFVDTQRQQSFQLGRNKKTCTYGIKWVSVESKWRVTPKFNDHPVRR